MALRVLVLLAFGVVGLTGKGRENATQDSGGIVSEKDGVQLLRSGLADARRRAPTQRPSPPADARRRAPTAPPSLPADARRRAPAPTPPPSPLADARRRAPTAPPSPPADARRRAPAPTPPPSPPADARRRAPSSADMGNPSTRRRINNNDRVDDSRRRSDIRRRSYSGWNQVDYSRRRGASIAAAATLGFAGGLVMGSLITRPGGEQYYFHQHSWVDMNGVQHFPGYYSPTGYHYASASALGYVPPPGAPSPDCYSNCRSRSSPIVFLAVGCCCCCCLIAAFLYGSQGKQESSEHVDPDVELIPYQNNNPDPETLEGQTIPRADAVAFIQAAEAEYVDEAEGAIGQMFDSRDFLLEVRQRLACEEDAIRDSEDRQGAVNDLASRWGMNDMLNHS